ncbi:hypothetical protein [Streptomyces sp. NPDC048710]|uniref:hypothetical protein n=1 Tax=Streptomyces sp. NPDC048710 TaxID=3365586 RepID=UPI00371AEE1C
MGAVRTLRELAAVVTGVTPFDDPWDERSAAEIGRQAVLNATTDDAALATPTIPPQTWWPLIRAAWTYIHTFAPDILRWKLIPTDSISSLKRPVFYWRKSVEWRFDPAAATVNELFQRCRSRVRTAAAIDDIRFGLQRA